MGTSDGCFAVRRKPGTQHIDQTFDHESDIPLALSIAKVTFFAKFLLLSGSQCMEKIPAEPCSKPITFCPLH
jgi:hypothetical protein